MKCNLKQPCNDCPWRRKAQRGWLGNGDPTYFVSAALADEFGGEHVEGSYAEPCHQTVDYQAPDWQEHPEEHEVCVGAAIFYRNVDPWKLPREPRRSKVIASVKPDHETVFSTAEEFIEHHTTGNTMRSWEQAS